MISKRGSWVLAAILCILILCVSSLQAAPLQTRGRSDENKLTRFAPTQMADGHGLQGGSEACVMPMIPVPAFGGDAQDPNARSSYPAKDEAAHKVTAVGLIFVMMVWSLFFFDVISSSTAFVFGGGFLISMGLYLVLWLFYLLLPENIPALHDYVTRDVGQQQHLIIALCLISAGFNDVFIGRGWLHSKNWHTLSLVSISLAGMAFMAHPQDNPVSHAEHLYLGAFIVFGAVLFNICKRETDSFKLFTPSIFDPLVACSSISYLGATIVLLAFAETPANMLYLHSSECNGVYYFVFSNYFWVAFSLTAPVVCAVYNVHFSSARPSLGWSRLENGNEPTQPSSKNYIDDEDEDLDMAGQFHENEQVTHGIEMTNISPA